MMGSRVIVYSAPRGYLTRNLLRTGVPELLLKDKRVRIVILTPAYNEPEFVKEFSFDGRVAFRDLPEYKTTLDLSSRFFWKLCVTFSKDLPVKWVFLALMNFNRKFSTPKALREYYRRLFDEFDPALIVTSTPGLNSQSDIPLINEAKNRKIKTLCLIHSWDNLAGGKGVLPTRPDFLGVWNELQVKEAMKLHFYDSKDVRAVGAPHFDIYFDKGIYMGRESFFRQMGLDPGKKLITITTASVARCENTFILDELIDFLKDNKYAVGVQLFCRLHPLDDASKYKKYLDNPYLKMERPGRYSDRLKWNPDRTEMVHLANTLRYTDIIVNVASTITLEASILDVPVVNLGYSSSEPQRFKKHILGRAWRYHYRYIKERNCTYIAQNNKDLLRGINGYLLDPAIHREGRKKLVQDLCCFTDGRTAARISGYILELTGRQ